MHIPTQTLAKWMKGNKDITIGTAHLVIKRFYCYPMTNAETCPKECEKCQELLTRQVNLGIATNPAAMLTFRLRDEVSRIIDKKPKKEIEVSDIGNDENPFLFLMKEFDETTTPQR